MVKTITVTNEAYEAMKRMKRENESFSDVFLRMNKTNNCTVDDIFGVLKNKKDYETAKRRIAEMKRIDKEKSRKRYEYIRHLSNN